MRQYVFSNKEIQNLFVKIMEQLSGREEHFFIIQGLLKDICEHFRFSGGFIYEADHTGNLILNEAYKIYSNARVPTIITLAELMSPEEIEALKSNRLYLYMEKTAERNKPRASGLPDFFNASSLVAVPVTDTANHVVGLVVMADRRHDILLDEDSIKAAKTVLNLIGNHVHLRLSKRHLEYSREFLIHFMNSIGVDIYVNDFYTHEVLYANRSMAAPYGGLDKMMGRPCWQVLYDDKTEECDFCPKNKLIDGNGNPSKMFSWDYQRPFDGAWFRVVSVAFPWLDGRMAHVITSVDITENKFNELIISRLANHDPLTHLPNRRKFISDCAQTLNAVTLNGQEVYLLFFDLDNFKNINDALGHNTGDELLRQVGLAMDQSPLTKDHCYRLGGDEFVILYKDMNKPQVIEVVDFLLELFNCPWNLEAGHVTCRASIGVAYYPADGHDAETLLNNADKTMYEAKRIGPGLAVFSDGEIRRLKVSTSAVS